MENNRQVESLIVHTWLWHVRWALPIAVAGGVAWVIVDPGKASRGGLFVLTMFLLLLGVLIWRMGVHPSVRISATGMRVHRMIGKVDIAWDQVRSVEPGRGGLVVETMSGERVMTNPLGGKTNISLGLEIDTYADRLADWLTRLAASSAPDREKLLVMGAPRRRLLR